MLYDDYKEETDEKKNPRLHRMLDQVKEYAGESQGMYDYVKLCKLLDEDIEAKEKNIRFEVEKEYGEKALLPSAELEKPLEGKPEGTPAALGPDGKPISPSANPLDHLSIKQQIISHYARIPMSKDAIIKHLVPNGRFIEPEQLKRCLFKDIKEIDKTALEEYVQKIGDNQKFIEKATLRDALFQDGTNKNDLKNLNFEDQIDQVYSDIDIEQKNAINKNQLEQGCKYLGLNLSQKEVDTLFSKYKHRDAAFMDRNGFSRLVKYEYCKEISKDRIVQDRLEELMPHVDPHRKGRISQDQLRFLFSKINSVPTPGELDALMKACEDDVAAADKDKDYSATANVQKLTHLVCHADLQFLPEKEDLNNGIVKIRSKMYSNISEQYNGFKFMPSNYVSSFSEDMYQTNSKRWPTSTLRPQLADCRSYYTNLSPPTSGEVRLQQKVAYTNLVLKIRKTYDPQCLPRVQPRSSNRRSNS